MRARARDLTLVDMLFRLLSGMDHIVTYTFNTGAAKHLFCAVCGIKSFYVPRSNPDGFSINLRCLDDPRGFDEVRIVNFDGKGDWEGAHEWAQADEGGDGDWVHAYLHRKEGDAGNAAYWYRRARRAVAQEPLETEWAAIAEALLAKG